MVFWIQSTAFADLCVNTRLFGDSTWILAPGDDALKRPVTDRGPPESPWRWKREPVREEARGNVFMVFEREVGMVLEGVEIEDGIGCGMRMRLEL